MRSAHVSDDDDPFDDELVPLAGAGKRKTYVPDPDDGPDEGDELDRVLAFQPPNHMGDAQRVVLRVGQDIIFVRNVGWFVWDTSIWNWENGKSLALIKAMEVAAAIGDEVRALYDKPGRVAPKKIADLAQHAKDAGMMAGLNGMMAAAEPFLMKRLAMFDAHPFLLAAPNGTIELGPHCELRESRREDYLSRSIAVRYSTKAQCPRFLKFIERIVPNDDMRAYLQRILGYCLTGSTREQAFFIFYGGGQNGKSTLLNVVRYIMGDCAMVTPVATFLAKREGSSGSEHSTDLARLPGARLVTAAEPPENAKLDEGRIKDVTGGETISARDLNKGIIEFKPIFKPIIATNPLPMIRGSDRGIWRRIRLFPFSVEIPDAEKDPELEGKLILEAEGILQWMLTGTEEWFAIGLQPPAAACDALDSYRSTQDLVGEFMKDCCVRTDDRIDPSTERKYDVNAKELYGAFKRWCEEQAFDPLTHKTFGSKLTVRGIGMRKTNGKTMRVGLQLKASVAHADYSGPGLVEERE